MLAINVHSGNKTDNGYYILLFSHILFCNMLHQHSKNASVQEHHPPMKTCALVNQLLCLQIWLQN